MSGCRHTPGPWTADVGGYRNHQQDHRCYAGKITSESGDVYAGPFSFWSLGGRTAEESQANARLIAAAPELLAACEAFLACMNAPSPGGLLFNLTLAGQQMTAAVAKAKGEQP